MKPLPTSTHASEFEKNYQWLEAANEYKKDIHLETGEKMAYALYRAAFQSQDSTQFRETLHRAIDAYAQACKLHEDGSRAKQLRCQAFTTFLSSMLKDDPKARQLLLDKSLEKDLLSLEQCRQDKDIECYIETCNNYLLHLLWRSEYSRDHNEVKYYIEQGYEAAAYLLDIGEDLDLTSIRQYLSAILLDKPMEVFDSLEVQQDLMDVSSENAQKAFDEATEKQDHYLIAKSALALGYITFEVKGDLDAALELVAQALDSAFETRDVRLIAQANEYSGYLTSWHINYITDDPTAQDTMNQKAFQHTEEAIRLYQMISKPIGLAYLNHVGYHYHSARNEENLEKKLEYTRRGMVVGYNDLEETIKTGSELGRLFVLNELLHLMFGLVRYVKDEDEKRGILRETEGLVDDIIDVSSRIQPHRIWNMSVFKFQSARLKIARARLEEDPEKKVSLFMEALDDSEECIELSKAHLEANPSQALSLDYAVGIRQVGELLSSLYSSTKDPAYLARAIDTYEEVLDIYKENELYCRAAETYWKIATINDDLGNYVESADAFDRASASYKMSSKKLSHLNDFYIDYGTYMEAWGEITRAKLHHFEERYEKVNELYTRAAMLHASTTRWNYLTSNYEAWAELAEAERLSQEGRSSEAKELFLQVADTFKSSSQTIQEIYPTIGVREEQEMAQNLIHASDTRWNYCQGRACLEEARILSRSDEHAESARKYRESVGLFQKVLPNDLSSPERSEIIPIITLCNAWEMMELAEAEASPERYESAARLFNDATELCYTNRTRFLSQGHSNFCSALYEYSIFDASRNPVNLNNANNYLRQATNFYLKAGFDDAMEYSTATQRLYEAYMYMDKASNETQPDKKARYFLMAEQLLSNAAKSYQRANHPFKQRDVLRLLDHVKRERQVATSLIQVLNAPNISSSTMSFTPPSPTREYPAGLESFEHGNIQTTMHIRDTDLRSGENLTIVLEMTNTGISVATLKSITDLPVENFTPMDVSGVYTFSDDKIDLRSRRLAPLSSEMVTITMNPRKRGDYIVNPHVEYEDEAGDPRVCETDKVEVTVSEMGLRGWLRGPTRKRSG
jgi:hypothetical protein